jgi:type I restriction enzyme S subunit
MAEWKDYTVADVISTVIDYRGKTPKKLGGDWSASGYRALSAKNIKMGKIVQDDSIRYVSEEMYKKWMKEEIQKEDILITSEAPFGQIYYWDSDEKIVLSQRLFAIRVNQSFYPKYIYFYMTSAYFQAELDGRATGTTVVGLRQPELLKCKILAPEYQEQKKIADTLWCLEQKINSNEKINDNLEQQAQKLFSNFYERATESVPFTSIIQILGGGTPKTSESSYWNGDIPFFTPKDVGCPYTFMTEKTITEDGLNHCNSRLYPVNTIFVTARGTVGKVGLSGVPMAMNQSCYALVGKDIEQLLVYFYTLETVNSLKHKASGAVFDAITTKDFDYERVMCLSKNDSTVFLTIVSPIFKKILSNCLENKKLAELRDSLLPKLMSGEIDVSAIKL